MTAQSEIKRALYVKELTGARKRQERKLNNQTFFYSNWSVEDEVKFAVKEAQRGGKNVLRL